MNELALFAGAGGGLLGSRLLGWRTVCYVEKDPYCQKILQARIKDGYLDDAPIWDDARTFNGRPWAGLVDVVTAGFPCQPFSGAGKQLGEQDERNLWPDTLRIIREVGPEWLFLENVPRLLCFDYFGRILADLAESGFDARWDCIPASAVGAPHQRDRLWIVAHANRCKQGRRKQPKRESHRRDSDIAGYGTAGEMADTKGERCGETREFRCNEQEEWIGGGSQDMADTNGRGFEERTQHNSESKDDSAERHTFRGHVGGCSDQVPNSDSERQQEQRGTVSTTQGGAGIFFDVESGDWWKVEPPLGRMADGVPNFLDESRTVAKGEME